MHPVVALRIGRHDLLDALQHALPVVIRLFVGIFHLARYHLLIQSHGQRIHFDKLHAVGVVHVQRARQLIRHVAEQGSVDAPIHFVQHQ